MTVGICDYCCCKKQVHGPNRFGLYWCDKCKDKMSGWFEKTK